MAEGKNLILLFFCINTFSVILAFLCSQGGGIGSQNYSDGIISDLFLFSKDQNLLATGGPGLTPQFDTATNSLVNPQSSGFNVFEGLGLILDALKMILGVITLLTPIPVLDFLYSMGIPIIIIAPFAMVAVLIWITSLVELIGGRTW